MIKFKIDETVKMLNLQLLESGKYPMSKEEIIIHLHEIGWLDILGNPTKMAIEEGYLSIETENDIFFSASLN